MSRSSSVLFARATGGRRRLPRVLAAVAVAALAAAGLAPAASGVGLASISGTVSLPDGVDTAASEVSVTATSTTDWRSFRSDVAADGTYTIPDLPVGSYAVRFTPPPGSTVAAEYYDGAYTYQAAKAVTVATEAITGIDATLEVGGEITGTVAVPDGFSTEGSRVSASEQLSGAYGAAVVAPDGSYTIRGLSPGSYRVTFSPGDAGLVEELWDDVYDYADATLVPVALGGVVSGIDADFEAGGSISGVVTAGDGVALGNGATVEVSGPANRSIMTVATGGAYRISGLPAGLYQVRFSSALWSGGNALAEYWNDAPSSATATSVQVVAGAETSGIDATLGRSGSVSGKVTVPAGMSPAGVSVTVYDTTTTTTMPVAYGMVAADGTYVANGLGTGSYKVAFSSYNTGLLNQYWDKATSLQTATLVSVVAGRDTPAINATLVRGGAISGRVTLPAGVSPTSVSVFASSSQPGPGGGGGATNVLPDGSYEIGGLAAGDYVVNFVGSDAGLVSQYWEAATSWSAATPVTVALGATRTGVDATMVRGASISGVVRDADGPRAGVQVYASPVETDGAWGYSSTKPDGSYTISGLAAGSYRIEFSGGMESELVAEYYDDAQNQEDATPVVLAAEQKRTGIDATLARGSQVSGTVTGPDGKPVAEAWVRVQPTDPEGNGGYPVQTEVDGTYTVVGIPDGEYLVFVQPSSSSPLAPSYWGGATREAATPLALTSGEVRPGVDVSLKLGATISGTVRSYSGAAVPDAWVSLEGAIDFWSEGVPTDAAGRYTIVGLPEGGYTLVASSPNPDLTPQWWQNAPRWEDADLLEVTGSQVRTGVDFTLGHAGKITGSVTVPAGFDTYCVAAESPLEDGTGNVDCAEAGSPYVVGGLTTGSYLVSAWATTSTPGSSTLTRYYVSADRRSQATPVAVVAPSTATNVNVDLSTAVARGNAIAKVAATLVPASPVVGAPVTVNIAVTGTRGIPGGVVSLWSSQGYVGDAVLSGGKATLRHTFTDAESSYLSVDYAGDGVYGSNGTFLEVTPEAAPRTATTTILTSSTNPSVVGQPVTLTAKVQAPAGVPTGDVTFSGPGGGVFGTAPVTNGTATLVLDQLPLGATRVQAAYAGDATFAPSSVAVDQTVTAAPVPAVNRVEPPSGSPLGGTRVTLTGTGFFGVTQVQFGSTPGTSLKVLSPTTLQVTAPAGAEGAVPVVVSAGGGTSEASPASRFTYANYVAVTPARVLSNLTVSPDVVRCVQVAGQAGVPAEATGVFMNVTTVGPNGIGYVVVYPDTAGNGATKAPVASTVNFEPGADVANSAFVALPADGKVCYATKGASNVGVLMDVAGYTLAGSGLTMQTSTRLLDTRPGAVHVGTVTGPVTPGQPHTVQVTGKAGVPAGATAVLVNVTVTGTAGNGNLRVFAAGQAVPGTSVLNFAPGKDKANAAIVALSDTGKLSFFSDTFAGTATNPVQVIIDVVGYVEAGSAFTAITPSRALDTRSATQTGPFTGPLAPPTIYALDMTSKVPAGATAVVLNVTAVGPTSGGNLRVYPDSDGTRKTPAPLASSINYVPGRDIPNMVVVGLPANGVVDLYSDQSGSTHLIVDVVGYLGATG